MHVVVAPVLVGTRVCRIVAAVSSLLEVEEWSGEWWEPSSVALTVAATSPAASAALLIARGIPAADSIVHGPSVGLLDIEALLRTHDPEPASPMRLDEDVVRARPPKTRSYPGNVRFRRAVGPSVQVTDMNETKSDERTRGSIGDGSVRKRPKRP